MALSRLDRDGGRLDYGARRVNNATAAEHEAAVAVGWTRGFKRFNRAVCPAARPTMPDVRRLWPNTMGPAIPPGRLIGVAIWAVRPRLSAGRYRSPAAISISFFFSSCVFEIWDWTGLSS